VARLLERRGAVVVDCDALGRLVVEPGGRAYDGVVASFGPAVVGPGGHIDRAALASVVFADPAALARLNALTHPAIDDEIAARVAAAPPGSIVVLDMAVLVETELGAGQYEVVVVVEADLDVRIDRLAQRGLDEASARARIAAQANDEQRRAVADCVVRNDGDLESLDRDVARLWDHLVEGRDPSPA
jgi:dephospho-CoA kinase